MKSDNVSYLTLECDITNVTHEEGDDHTSGANIVKECDVGPHTRIVEEREVDNKHQFKSINFIVHIIG